MHPLLNSSFAPPKTATIVITTRNRKDDLRTALHSAHSQKGPVDVLAVDDASTDGTSEMLAREFPKVRVDRSPEPRGNIFQRNPAAQMVRTGIIVSIDDDAVFTTPDTETI